MMLQRCLSVHGATVPDSSIHANNSISISTSLAYQQECYEAFRLGLRELSKQGAWECTRQMTIKKVAPPLIASSRRLCQNFLYGISMGRGNHGSSRPVRRAVTSHLVRVQRIGGSESCRVTQDSQKVSALRTTGDCGYNGMPSVSAVRVCHNSSGGHSVGWENSRFYSSAANSGGPVPVDPSTLMDEDHFHDLADDVLHNLQEKIEILGEDLNVDGFDSDYADGVLTVRLGSVGTYVINKQTPNRQIWLSSPVSGPGRFDWVASRKVWVYRRTQDELVGLLEKELSQLLGTSIHLS